MMGVVDFLRVASHWTRNRLISALVLVLSQVGAEETGGKAGATAGDATAGMLGPALTYDSLMPPPDTVAEDAELSDTTALE